MISPNAGLSVKGAIFHQGYNNCFRGTPGAVFYHDVFPRMIAAWRAAFNDPELPFGIISLCTEGPPQTRDNFVQSMANAGPYIREAQYRTFLELYEAGDKNIGFASTYDLRRRWYHPQLKIPAGERIARWALATEYGFEQQIRWKPPMVPKPAHYRCAWARNPMGNLQAHHNTDIPLATQRSDDWPMEDIPRGVLGENPSGLLDRGQKGRLREALQQEDLQRRLEEARALIEANPSK